MYLKKIIANGFKSFADKVVLTLDKERITGIVGPNGSGKSNVIDAVRWVMGEQNAKMLRGEKATDIIFNGAQKRKALGMAEVTLVFDNSEASHFCPPEYRHEVEISLTRRIYMDGSREYLMNRRPCRLRDLVGFFTSSGLGGRSYSMIQQGQVDRILQAKPEALREILEEAAGTIIFKKRKDETEKKLSTTQVNLSRLEDLLQEIVRQMDSLKEQADEARLWTDLQEELKSKESQVFKYQHEQYKEKVSKTQKSIHDLEAAEAAALAKEASFQQKLTLLKEELDQSDPELARLTEDMTSCREKIAASEASLQAVQDLIMNSSQQEKSLQESLVDAQLLFEKTQMRVKNADDTLKDLFIKKEEIEEILENEALQVEQVDEQILVFDNQVEELTEELRSVSQLLETNSIRRKMIEQDHAKLSRKKSEMTTKLMELEDSCSHSKMRVEGFEVKAKNNQTNLDESLSKQKIIDEKIRQKNIELKKQKEAYEQINLEFVDLRARLASLKELESNSADWANIILALEKDLPEDKKFSFTKSLFLPAHKLIQITAQFEKLPDFLVKGFDQWMQRIFIRDHQHLTELTKLITNKSAAVIPAQLLSQELNLDKIFSWAKDFGALSLKPYLKLCFEDKVLSQFLERLWYLPKSKKEKDVLSKLPRQVVLFSEEGLTYTADGCLSLGFSKQTGPLLRQAKIQKLTDELYKIEAKKNNCQTQCEKLEDALISEQKLLSDLETKIFAGNKQVLEAATELRAAHHKLSMQEEILEDLRLQYNKIDEEYDKLDEDLEELSKNDKALSSEKQEVKQSLSESQEEKQNLLERKHEISRQYEQYRIDLITFQSKKETLQEHLDADRTQLDSARDMWEKSKKDYTNFSGKTSEAKKQAETLKETIASCLQKKDLLDEKLLSKKEANSEQISSLRQLEKDLEQTKKIVQDSRLAQSDKKNELEKALLNLKSLAEQASEKYELNLESHKITLAEDFELRKVSQRIASVRSKMSSFGPINMMAVDEYKNLEERHDFIAGQKAEVVSAMDLLGLAIDEIAENSKNKFMETFKVLCKEFSELFPILFPGGLGEIQLVGDSDSEDVSELGVEIMVCLPGKKRQSMRLFSGGEKALTAIALIFALLKSKPTPFCFLDEVDAPLDETNVGRYNKVLEALSGRFQFIVITHRRKTMEVLDTLYGVTMQEPGVSKVVGVDMEKALPTHLQKAFKEEGAKSQAQKELSH